jgi:hypothetical protein
MSKKLIYSCITALILLISGNICAQQVLSSTGGSGQNTSGSISYTLGELVIETRNDGSRVLTQGFHQTEILVTALHELSNTDIPIVAYPNPTHDFVTLKFEYSEIGNIEYILLDLRGRLLFREKLTGNEAKISFQSYGPGCYFIKVSVNGKEIQTFKILKK